MQNRALRQEPRYEPATVIPLKQEDSLIEWLEANNRLISREVVVENEQEESDTEELSNFIEEEPDYEEDDSIEEIEA
ncbi:MAG: DUF3134 domain-containing protein [Prochloraceae cyanobacterium]|nr:DUF3134 domain-containing protein [Prochloraceae cyanobacterium]